MQIEWILHYGYIIQQKNNNVYGYVSDEQSIVHFQVIAQSLKLLSDYTGQVIEENILLNHNPKKQQEWKHAVAEFQTQVNVFNEYMNSYYTLKQQQSYSFMMDALQSAQHFYLQEMIPKLREIRQLKWKVSYVEVINDQTPTLIQKTTSPDTQYYFDSSNDQIIRLFGVG
jgi:hypothetical protein